MEEPSEGGSRGQDVPQELRLQGEDLVRSDKQGDAGDITRSPASLPV